MIDGLKAKYRAAIISILSANERVERAVLFGSRAMETFTSASDIDIALYGDHLTLTDQVNLATVIDELPMAQRVDLLLHATVNNEALCKHIEEHGIEWYRRGTAERLDLPRRYREQIEALLREHVPGVEVWAYGSRVNGRSHEGSDLDLVLRGPDLKRIDSGQLMDLTEALEESNVPIIVQTHDWARLPERFHREIERKYVVLVEKEGWKTMTLGEFAPFTYGKGLPVGKRNPLGTIPVFGSNGIVGYHDSSLTEGPTIIIGRKGTVGAVHYSPIPCWPIDTTFFITGNDSALTRFKYYALSVLGLEHMNSDSAVPGLNRSDAHARTLLLPEESEQRAIAHILGTLDDKIELNRRMNETLEEMARALFKSWFVDFDPVRAKMEGRDTGLPPDVADLFPDRLVESELGEIPEGWEVSTIGDVANVSSGKRPSVRCPVASAEAVVPVWGGNGPMAFTAEPLIEYPILITGRVGTLGSVFRVTSPCWPSDNTLIIRASSNQCFEYLFFQVERIDFNSLNRGSTQPLLTQSDLKAQPIILPPLGILEQFNDFTMCLFDKCDRGKYESETLTALRDTLLPKLISGEMRVNTRDEESEAVIGKNQ